MRYISCQTCHHPIANNREGETGQCYSCSIKLTDLQLITGMDEAIQLLIRKRQAVAGGSMTIWRMLTHAIDHLDQQIADLMAPTVPCLAPSTSPDGCACRMKRTCELDGSD